MAAAKSRPAKGGKKTIRGRMPVKRSINLVLVDENKISPLKAVIGIVLILALAALFGKFLVADRLAAVSTAKSRVSRLSDTLDDTKTQMAEFGKVEETYAHYTYAGMTKAELGLVDRTQIMALVGKVFESEARSMTPEEFEREFNKLMDMFKPENAPFNMDEFMQKLDELVIASEPIERTQKSWNVVDNLLTVEMTGESPEKLNELAREIASNPIVDTCTITTANKGTKDTAKRGVWARLIIYLCQPPEEVAES